MENLRKVNCEFLQYIGVTLGHNHNILYNLRFLCFLKMIKKRHKKALKTKQIKALQSAFCIFRHIPRSAAEGTYCFAMSRSAPISCGVCAEYPSPMSSPESMKL